MRGIFIIPCMALLLFIPAIVMAQSSDRITILDNFGTYDRGEPLFIYGQITGNLEAESFLIMQIINPHGDLCQIQQLVPLPSGAFITNVIPMEGRICGIPGEYETRLFYGDYSTSTTFNVSEEVSTDLTDNQKLSLATTLITNQRELIADTVSTNYDLDSALPSTITELESVYVDLWIEFLTDTSVKNLLIYETSPLIRPAITTSLDSVRELASDGQLSALVENAINRMIFSALFYYEIGDKPLAIGKLTNGFVDIKNANPPEDIVAKRTPTFDELETTLLNLMKKSGTIMSKAVKNEVGFIFARGTAPLYADEIPKLIDILSESRYLDVVSRKQSDLYNLVQNAWSTLKPSLQEKNSIADLIESNVRVSEVYDAAILLRQLDNVERFVTSDPESEEDNTLIELLTPEWENLVTRLATAGSVGNILDLSSEINEMAQIIDISSRITKIVQVSQSSGTNPSLISNWEQLLERVDDAQSTDEILQIISEFNESLEALREKRSPLVLLEFEYNAMKAKAEVQADYGNLILIDSALKIIKTAKQMEDGNPSVSRIDRIDVLVAWASEKAPVIKSDLNSYTKDVFKVRAADILQRAKSLENLVESSLTKKRFLPNYIEFTEEIGAKIDDVQNLVIANELEQADDKIRALFDEWSLVSKAYQDDPYGSEKGYNSDELKRIDFRNKLAAYENAVSNFENSGFDDHYDKYEKLVEDTERLIMIANFVDAESKIKEIGEYLSKYLVLGNDKIIYDIVFDAEKNHWIIQGYVEKSRFDEIENLYLTIYNMDGSVHSTMEFTDTKQGRFYTPWNAPVEPGLYVALLQYQNSKATQIVHIEEEFDYTYGTADLNLVELAREFEELEAFAREFGAANLEKNSRFASVIDEIETSFEQKNAGSVSDNLEKFKTIIERYLPIRNPNAPIEAVYNNGELLITGGVRKTVEFSEDLFIDVYDQSGNRIDEIVIKDNYAGYFTEVVSHQFDSGLYVVKVQYHNIVVTDFFTVP